MWERILGHLHPYDIEQLLPIFENRYVEAMVSIQTTEMLRDVDYNDVVEASLFGRVVNELKELRSNLG